MNYIEGIQNAIEYIEAHLTEEPDAEEIASRAAMSPFYFQRIFGMLCGVTLGEYIRFRKLSLAGLELANTDSKIIEIALKYGYETPESFSRAFTKFHGISPRMAKANKDKLKYFSPFSVKITLSGGKTMDYRIAEKPEMILTGYRMRFTGAPYGRDRERQEENLFCTTRAKQWILKGAAGVAADGTTEICVIADVDGEGYDFCYTVALDAKERAQLYNPAVTGIDCMERFGFEELVIPRQTYAVFATERKPGPIGDYMELREAIANEILVHDDLLIADGPELAVYHWYTKAERESRYVEIWIPIIKKE